jgi:cytochrome c
MNFLWQHSKYIFLAALLLLCSLNLWASTDDVNAIALAKQNACLGCHAVDKKIVGPSLQAIAKKYTNDPNARTFLKNKILKAFGPLSKFLIHRNSHIRVNRLRNKLLMNKFTFSH